MYFKWDYDEDRRALLQKRWSREDALLVFDELHKYPHWKAWVKGLHDVAGEVHRITNPFRYFADNALLGYWIGEG